MDKNKLKNIIYSFSFWLTCAILYIILFYSENIKNPVGDFILHNQFSELLYKGEMQIMYPGYHIVVGGLALALKKNVTHVSIVILTLSALASIWICEKIILLMDSQIDKRLALLGAFVVNFIQPIFTHNNRPGASSGNGYVSPTHIMCKPFIFLCIFLFMLQYGEKKWNLVYQTWLLVTLIISCIIKPIFAMAFVPAIGLMLLVDEAVQCKTFNIAVLFKSYWIKVWPLFFTGIFLIVQFIFMKSIKVSDGIIAGGTDGEAKICFGFMYAWKMNVKSVTLSLLYAYFTPIITWLCFMKKVRISAIEKKYMKMCGYYAAVSFFYISCLYQDKYASDLNFRNAWIVTFMMVYLLNVVVLLKENKLIKKWQLYSILPNIGLIVQMLFGIALYLKYTF